MEMRNKEEILGLCGKRDWEKDKHRAEKGTIAITASLYLKNPAQGWNLCDK